ncbi:MAG: glycine betaine ABC transporter substrate-binding protein [Euryarchaeota archaeon]|nr:glycine betaine ABC transporter substrate-binding protein [Euryarchaeota archaeon]
MNPACLSAGTPDILDGCVLMIRKGMKEFLIMGFLIAATLLVAGCTNETSAPQDGAVSADKTVVLASTPYDTERSSANVLKLVFEEAGYDLQIKTVDVGLAFLAVADGSADAFVGAWLPTCHRNYLESYEDQMDFVRVNMEGTRCGLVVPSYVEIDSIDELNDVKDRFDGKIIGIEPGAGIMGSTETAIDSYGLDYELVTASETSMIAILKGAIDDDEWVVVIGWSPHWKFVRWDLKYLDDPQNIYGGVEEISTFTRIGFADEMPGAYAILKRFHWTASDMESIMLNIEGGMSEEEAAAVWVDAHPDMVAEWLGTA